MIFQKKFAILFLPAVLFGAPASANTIADGTTTTFTDTNNGLSATFSSSADPGGFVIYPSMFETSTGNVLGDPGPAGDNNLDLDINFSQTLAAITLDFATADFVMPSTFTITAYENSGPRRLKHIDGDDLRLRTVAVSIFAIMIRESCELTSRVVRRNKLLFFYGPCRAS